MHIKRGIIHYYNAKYNIDRNIEIKMQDQLELVR